MVTLRTEKRRRLRRRSFGRNLPVARLVPGTAIEPGDTSPAHAAPSSSFVRSLISPRPFLTLLDSVRLPAVRPTFPRVINNPTRRPRSRRHRAGFGDEDGAATNGARANFVRVGFGSAIPFGQKIETMTEPWGDRAAQVYGSILDMGLSSVIVINST
jgi:hypothetical protein